MRPNLHPNAYVNPYSTLFRGMNEVVDAMNRLNQSDTRPSTEAVAQSSAAPATQAAPAPRTVRLPVDAWMTDDAYLIRAFVPGVNPDDVEIVFEDDELTIRGSFPTFQPVGEGENGEKAANVVTVKRELFEGRFERRLSFRLPVNADAIEAAYSQGVLTLRVPKAEAVKPRQIRVTAK